MSKKYILLLFIFCVQLAPAKAQWVTIPDPNFVTALQQSFPSCMNGNQMDTTCVTGYQSLYLNNLNISDLTGLQYFDGLTYLYCQNNQLSLLPALPANLAELDCSFNQLTHLPLLPQNLWSLRCFNNQLTWLPFLPINIQELLIQSNPIACLPNIPYLLLTYDFSTTSITCLPEYSPFIGAQYPICLDNDPVNNPNACPSSATISGHVYKDLNQDCTFDTGETGTENMLVKLYGGSTLIATTNVVNGAYGFQVNQSGTYTVEVANQNAPFVFDCGTSNSVQLNLNLPTVNNSVDFPVDCDGQFRDIGVQSHLIQGWVFPGQIHTFRLELTDDMSWFNLSCDSNLYSGTVTIQVNGPVTYVAPAFNALVPQVNGTTFTYSISDFSNINPSSFGLQFLTDTTAQAGNQVCVNVQILPTPLDANIANNTYNFCYQVVNSYDPNMKEVYPVNVLPGYDDWFTYTIHFQNTGNAPAFNIRLRDTLDANLDINTFEIRGYSHPAIVSLNGNNLTVRFNNIMLPDSTTDYEGSMGYFQYRIKPLPNLPLGTQIENTAYIYFDYNAPIITNTTQNNFQLVTNIKSIDAKESNFVIYPNPSTGIYFFKDNRYIQTVEVFNMMGELILSQGNAKQINLQAYPKGIYVARINGSVFSMLVKE